MMLRRLLVPVLFLFSLSACAQPAAPNAAKPAVKPATATAPVRPAQTYPSFIPKLGLDYFVLPQPEPTFAPGKIEVAEVFSYRCIHCAEFQPKVNAYKKTLPADVRWEYVPAVFGGPWDTTARAFFAAQLLGVQPRTHDAVFKGIFVDQIAGDASVESLAKMYGTFGVDSKKMLDTMNSFGVTAKLSRARQFALRAGVDGTPTIVINGKYRVPVTVEHGFEGMLSTTTFLLQQERAAAAKK